jgi:hypothetical protein
MVRTIPGRPLSHCAVSLSFLAHFCGHPHADCRQAACDFFSFGKFVLHHFPDNIVQLLQVLAQRWILEYSSVTRRYFRFKLLSAEPRHRL